MTEPGAPQASGGVDEERLEAARLTTEMVETALAGSIATLNHNAVSVQEHARQTRSMALAKVCARIAATSKSAPPPPPLPAADSPPAGGVAAPPDVTPSDYPLWSPPPAPAASRAAEASAAAGRERRAEGQPGAAPASAPAASAPREGSEAESPSAPETAEPPPEDPASGERRIDSYRDLFRAIGRRLRGDGGD